MIETELLDIIGLIYDAAIRPPAWAEALETIRVRHGWFNSVMSLISLPEQTTLIALELNNPPDMADYRDVMTRDSLAMWGGAERFARFPLEEPLLQSDQTDPATWVNYTFAREWGFRHRITDQVGMVLARDRTSLAGLSFSRQEWMAVPLPQAMDELRILAPHLRRAATINRLLETMATRAATFEAALDAATAGAVLVRGDMGIVHANAAADAMLKHGDPIRSDRGRLRLTEELAPGHLSGAVEAAAQGAAAIGRRGLAIPTRRRDGSPLVTHVLPLEGRLGQKTDADAVVFVADNGGAQPLQDESLALLFGLTPAEARVFELVVAGRQSREITAAMGVAPSTFRTHLLRVYDKTGRHRRADLVALAREIRPGS